MTGKQLAHYSILEKLGEGGMGVVYKGRDTRLDRVVAIKVLPAESVANPERRRRFVHEAKAASALNHPNIITVHDIDQEAGVDFIVMEYVAGQTLARLIARGLVRKKAVKYAIQIADALAAAHTVGIVHRDLKPANVMVTEAGLVKVLDFGLAKLTAWGSGEDGATRTLTTETAEGMVVGTCAYMAPEQAEGRAVDARFDIFSFGAVLYEMLSGRRAFAGPSNLATLTAVLHNEPAPLGGDVPLELERIVTRCLRKNPVERFQSAGDVKRALEEAAPALERGAGTPSIAVLPFANLSTDWYVPHFQLAMQYTHMGMFEEAIALGQKACELSGRNAATVGTLAVAYGLAGRPSEARALLEELTSLRRTTYVPPFAMAAAYRGLGEMDQVLEWLEKGVEERDLIVVTGLRSEPRYVPLRGHPRYQALLRKMNLER